MTRTELLKHKSPRGKPKKRDKKPYTWAKKTNEVVAKLVMNTSSKIRGYLDYESLNKMTQ